ncbi:MAG: hypothetical protein Q4E64_08080 [Phascolarctobacterium sp.]|uniref:hypothetical protein n=1 Tax=Phascolarctobacterium sp. TaxID=2049039 RepID=UPI0026DB18D3|nr:hypothetical protein [Phascolarctobacterium sp.]MDO4921767.1 hypothetical protein [Phascolarctobacterium sp.]
MTKILFFILMIAVCSSIIGCGNDSNKNNSDQPVIKTEQSKTPTYKEQYADHIDNQTKTGFPIDVDVIRTLLNDGSGDKFTGYKRFKPEYFLNKNTNYPCIQVINNTVDGYGPTVAKTYVSGPTIKLLEKISYNGNPGYGVSCDVIIVQEPKSRIKTACGTMNFKMVILKENNSIKVYQALDGFNFDPNDKMFFKRADDMLYNIGLVCCDFLSI